MNVLPLGLRVPIGPTVPEKMRNRAPAAARRALARGTRRGSLPKCAKRAESLAPQQLRSTEVLTFDGEKIVAAEVYFSWNLE